MAEIAGELHLFGGSVFMSDRTFQSAKFLAPKDLVIRASFRAAMVSLGKGAGTMEGSIAVDDTSELMTFQEEFSTDSADKYRTLVSGKVTALVPLPANSDFGFKLSQSNTLGYNIATYFDIFAQRIIPDNVQWIYQGNLVGDDAYAKAGEFKAPADGILLCRAKAQAVGFDTGWGGITILEAWRQSGKEQVLMGRTQATAGWSLLAEGSDHKTFDATLSCFVRAGDVIRFSAEMIWDSNKTRRFDFTSGNVDFMAL